MNWKLTLAKGLVVGALAALGVWAADLRSVQAIGPNGTIEPWLAGAAVLALETVRDLIKARFGRFVPNG